jgi:transposase InsO family protein
MNAIMNDTALHTIEQVEAFLALASVVEFHFETTTAGNAWIQATLVRFAYVTLPKAHKGIVRRYVQAVTGYSRAQVARLIRTLRRTWQVRRRQAGARHRFPRHYTAADIRALAKTDELHGTLSGPATKKLFERAFQVFGDTAFERLASISIGHLYNLRKGTGYVRQRQTFTKTRPRSLPIGHRRKPTPEGKPGYLRIDSVHQGDLDGRKGVYHINAVDAVTQFQVVACVERISEAYLIPALSAFLAAFPFVIRGFHSDNGSEYVNYQVATLLNKLLIEFTKSRSRHTNDNALVEGKNAASVRKHFGYTHIPQHYAALINAFNQDHLIPYLNFHRPCFLPETLLDEKGKQRKRYRYEHMMTPYEKLKSLALAAQYLREGMTFDQLDALATQMSDIDAAAQLQRAKRKLFQRIHEQEVA